MWITSLQILIGKVTLWVFASGKVCKASAIFLSRHNLSAYLTIN